MTLSRFIIIFSLALASTLTVWSQDARQMFISTPDSLLPYVNKADRESLVAAYDKLDSDTCCDYTTPMGSKAILSTCSSDVVVFSPSEALTFEYGMLLTESNDSLLCLITTYKAPDAESTVHIYDKHWTPLNSIDLSEYSQPIRPDTLCEEKYKDAISLVEIRLISASFKKQDPKTIILQNETPTLNEEEKSKVKPLFLQRNVTWNGKIFK